jgi:hypothetical protein
MKHYRKPGLPKAILDRTLEVNGKATDVRSFLAETFYYTKDNTYPEKIILSSNEARVVIEMETGQTISIGSMEIKRIA